MSAAENRKELIRLFQRYNRRLGILYGQFIKELSKLGISVEDKLQADPLFNFAKFPDLNYKLDRIIKDYKSEYVNLYKQGISAGTALAFGQDAKNLKGYTIYNDDAITRIRTAASNAFTNNRLNSPVGLSLSQRIWNYVEQTKSEFEVAMSNIITDGLKKGTGAAELSQLVRSQLVNPDMMYRRYHHTIITAGGTKKDVVRWHKKVVDENGKVRFVEAPLEKVGRGVYRSSYKNSFRLMRSEINMSYHYANNERWMAEPFVIGIRIQLSPEHPEYDMCDELAGDYPKDFMWASWHPQCLCMSSAILCSEEELKEITKRAAKGEDISQYKSPNLITDVPGAFKKYIDSQHDKIIASAKRGTLGYYLRDNKKYWVGQFNAEERKQMGVEAIPTTKNAFEVARLRHAKRTQTQVDDILHRWDVRRIERVVDTLATATKYNKNITMPDFVQRARRALLSGAKHSEYLSDLNKSVVWSQTIEKANIRHAARTAQDIDAIKAAWQERNSLLSNQNTLKLTVQDFRLLETKASAGDVSQRGLNLVYNLKLWLGEDSFTYKSFYANFIDEFKKKDYYLSSQMFNTLQRSLKGAFKGYQEPFNCIDHLSKLRKADLSILPDAWKKEASKIIKQLNAFDLEKKGFSSQLTNIEYLYNMFMLAKNKSAIAIGIDNISSKMPYQIFTVFEKKIPGFAASFTKNDKKFFDALSQFVPLYTKNAGSTTAAYYWSKWKCVWITPSKENIARLQYEWYQAGLFHHEYGHAMDDLNGWSTNTKFTELYDRFVAEVTGQGKPDCYKNLVAEKLKELSAAGYTQYQNGKEMLGSFTDCLQAALPGHQFIAPLGHSAKYFSNKSLQMAEFIAHMSENYWSTNPIFEEIAPTLYDEMRELIKEALGL